MMEQLARYYRTLRPLRAGQLLWQLYRRLRPVTQPAEVPLERSRRLRAAAGFCAGPQPADAVLSFLNQTASADPDELSWHPSDRSRLWRYHLHYFDYLQWRCIPADWKTRYIDDWIAANPVGTATAWEPYPVSLRIVNWLKYFSTYADDIPQHWQHSLLNQLHWLTHNLEHHLLANHLLKNAKALLLGGLWFKGANGQRFQRLGEHYFIRELREQLLPDGGHVERSPMYHSIVLEDCLDVLNFALPMRAQLHPNSLHELQRSAQHMLGFLADVTLSDGDIARFNDAASGVAPAPADLHDYGHAVCGHPVPAANDGLHPIRRSASGYYGYRHRDDSLLIDCGPVGPDYQPGHAHCDMLSFELCIDGLRVIVDPGVHGYDGDPTRNYLRSTAAHNTVVLNDAEQSELWGTFRVGRRARPLTAELTDAGDGRLLFSGSHDGYRYLDAQATHQRCFDIDVAGRWEVRDVLSGGGDATAVTYLHLAPSVEAVTGAGRTVTLRHNGTTVAELEFAAGMTAEIESGYVAPYFGCREPAQIVALRCSGPLPLELSYRLQRPAVARGH